MCCINASIVSRQGRGGWGGIQGRQAGGVLWEVWWHWEGWLGRGQGDSVAVTTVSSIPREAVLHSLLHPNSQPEPVGVSRSSFQRRREGERQTEQGARGQAAAAGQHSSRHAPAAATRQKAVQACHAAKNACKAAKTTRITHPPERKRKRPACLPACLPMQGMQ